MPQELQTGNPQLTPDESAASLAFATYLQEQMMGINPGASQNPETAQGDEETQEPQEDLTPRIEGLESQFNDFREEVKKTIKDEVGGIKQMIKDLSDGEE